MAALVPTRGLVVVPSSARNMLALPGRTYDLDGPGWQQENWGMGPGHRGFGSHRSWLPWISVDHLHGITGLEELIRLSIRD